MSAAAGVATHIGWRFAMNDHVEIWKPIPSAPFLEASSLGRIRALKAAHRNGAGERVIEYRIPRLLSTVPNNKGYMLVGVAFPRPRRVRSVHTLVLEAFVGPRPNGLEAAHLDGDHTNNAAANLAWVSKAENAFHRVLHGTSGKGEESAVSKLSSSDVYEIRNGFGDWLGNNKTEIAKRYGVSRGCVNHVLRRSTWSHL
jgi:hypothetical protein